MRERNGLKKFVKRICGRNANVRAILLLAALAAIMSVGGTLAFLATKTGDVVNTFVATPVELEVKETFDGYYKKNVNVTNTGETSAYVRVKLVSYRVGITPEGEVLKNPDGQPFRIGGSAEIPEFTPGDGWFKGAGDDGEHTYYYKYPVKPIDPENPKNEESSPKNPLIGSEGILLCNYESKEYRENHPEDTDGGIQVIEVMAEAIQADGINSGSTDSETEGMHPVEIAWTDVKVVTENGISVLAPRTTGN